MKRYLLPILLALSAPAFAFTTGNIVTYSDTTGAHVQDSGVSSSTVDAQVATNTALQAACTGTSGCPAGHVVLSGGVWRLAFAAAHDAPPVFYTPSNSACSAADNGGQVSSADSKCWLAVFPGDGADVRAWGAKCDNSTDDSTAFQNAVAWASATGGATKIVVPQSTCLLNATFTGAMSVTLAGSGNASVLSPHIGGAPVVTWSGGNRDTMIDLKVIETGFGSGDGILLTAGQNDSKLLRLVVAKFPGKQIRCEGTIGTPLSGNDVRESYILNPSSATTGIYYSYCNDFHIVDNQTGVISVATFSSGDGIDLENASGGQARGNFSWQNNRGIVSNGGSFNWIAENRLTQSGKQNADIETGHNIHFIGNQLYQGSNASTGTYESAKFVGVANSVIENNQFFDWTGSAHVNYHLTIDATSGTINVQGNYFDPNVTAQKTQISASAGDIISRNNIPTQDAYANACQQPLTWVAGASRSGDPTGGSGGTIYLGGGGANSSNSSTYWPQAFSGTVCYMEVIATVAPGVGQTETMTIERTINGTGTSATTMTGTLSGTNQLLQISDPTKAFTFNQGDNLDIKVVGSGGAAASNYQYVVGIAQ